MKQLLEYIVPNIVNHPEDVVITENVADGNVTLTIKVNPEDTGRVIGKAGKIINSIRQIARVLAIKQGVRVNVEIEDGQSGHRQEEPASESASGGEEMPVEETPVEETPSAE